MANSSINLPEGPEPVLSAATDISHLADDFYGCFTKLQQLVENDLSSAFQGVDYEAFKTKVENEKTRFDEMRDILVEYSSKLTSEVNAHVQRQEDSKTQVEAAVSFD